MRVAHWQVLDQFSPFLPGFTLFFRAAATWWIPLLLALRTWRYVVRKEPPRYEPALWEMVFPLRMYTTGTFQLSRATGFGFLAQTFQLFIYIALAAWLMAFAGLVSHLGARYTRTFLLSAPNRTPDRLVECVETRRSANGRFDPFRT